MKRLAAAALFFYSLTQLACGPGSHARSDDERAAPRSLELFTLTETAPTYELAEQPMQASPSSTPARANAQIVSVSPRSPQASDGGTCDSVMSQQALCACLTKKSDETQPGACQLQSFATPELATMTTPGGDTYAIAFYRVGWYALSRLHAAGMEDFAVRKARIEKTGTKRVARIVTYTQIGDSDWMHTANELVLCPLTKPGMANGRCSHYPLYAHTRAMVSDEPNEQESRFRVKLMDGTAHVNARGGALEHPELMAALGTHPMGE